MARILISESDDEARRLLEEMVARLGHEPIAVRAPTPQQLTSVDVFVIEPDDPIGVVLAQAAHLIDPSLPLVCASVTVPASELAELGVEFVATLVKPFTIEQLGAALELALRGRRAHRGYRGSKKPNHGNRAA
jgi:CheY-like chemotaxis protein